MEWKPVCIDLYATRYFQIKILSKVTSCKHRSQTSYTALCNGVSCHEAQFGSIQICINSIYRTECIPNVLHMYYVYITFAWKSCLHWRISRKFKITQIAADAVDTSIWQITFILIAQIHPIRAPCRNKNSIKVWNVCQYLQVRNILQKAWYLSYI